MHIRQSDCARRGEVLRGALNRRKFLAAAGGGALGLSVAGFACAEEMPAIAYESVPNVLSLRAIKTEAVISIIDQALKANLALANALDIRGTPGFVIGEHIVPGAIDLDALKNLVADARKG